MKQTHDIGYLLADARKQKRLSLRALAARCNIPAPNLNQIELGNRNPNWDLVEKILTGLEITPIELFIPRSYDHMIRDLLTHPPYYNDIQACWWFYYQNHVGKQHA